MKINQNRWKYLLGLLGLCFSAPAPRAMNAALLIAHKISV
jgi:hypothetical protein